MGRDEQPMPTDAELGILRVLWAKGPSTVRDVFEALAGDTGYTTVLKLMQIMAEKGLVKRDESRRSHVYSAVPTQEKTQQRMLGELIDKAFAGSAAQLVQRAVNGASKKDLEEIRALLDAAAAKGAPKK